ncbi:MAG TPA: UDP-N-acetylmuramoyl-L-alanine--D-glutamate ligase [Rhodocyclaceae bacterium]
MELRGKLVLVLGLGESGLAMARWCERRGARVRVADTRPAPPYLDVLRTAAGGAEFRVSDFNEKFDKSLLAGIDLVALSPGLSGGMMAVIHARAAGLPVVGEIELFAWGLRDLGLRHTSRVLAITGTNGKTTTTALTAHLCSARGVPALACGNISPAALTALMDAQDEGRLPRVWVLELSSFQLETLESLCPDAATVLNVSDDHLDRYIDLDEYAEVKSRIFIGEGVQVLNRDDARVKRMARDMRSIISFGLDAPADEEDFGLRVNRGEPWIVQGDQFLLPVSALPMAGLHNAANAMAALALCDAVDFDPVSMLPGLRSFKGLPHRVEKVDDFGGIDWYDDSKGTNVGATLAAINGLGPTLNAKAGAKIVLILGGDGKGQDFTPLLDAVKHYVRAVILIGRDGPRIGVVLVDSGVPLLAATDMEDAVQLCVREALPGDAVLLSPACASLDMFRNYAHRAEVFIGAVQRLRQETQ